MLARLSSVDHGRDLLRLLGAAVASVLVLIVPDALSAMQTHMLVVAADLNQGLAQISVVPVRADAMHETAL
jgi:hypothetical protein